MRPHSFLPHFDRQRLILFTTFLLLALTQASPQDKHIVWMQGGHTNTIAAVLISPDNEYALSISENAKLWSLETGELIHIFRMAYGSTWAPPYQFSPDGKYLAFGDSTRVGLWSLLDRRVIRYYDGLRGLISCLAFSNSSEFIAAGGSDSAFIIWSINPNEKSKELRGRGMITQIQFVDADHLLISEGPDFKSEIWDIASDKILISSKGYNFGSSVISRDSSNRKSLICIPGKAAMGRIEIPGVDIYNAYTGKLIKHLSADKRDWSYRALTFSPDGSTMAIGERDILRIYDWRTEKVQLSISITGLRGPIHFSPNGKYVASESYSRGVCVCDAHTGKEVSHFGTTLILAFEFSADSRRIVCGTYDGEVLCYNVETSELILRITSNNARIAAIIPSHAGSKVAAVAENGILTVWDGSTGIPSWSNRGISMKTKCAAFSSNDAVLATINVDEEYNYENNQDLWQDSELDFYKADSGSAINVLPAPSGHIGSLEFMDDGKKVLAIDRDKNRFVFWDTSASDSPTYKQLNNFYGGFGISSTGRFQIQSDQDIGWVTVFVPFTDSVIVKFHAHNGFVRTISFADSDHFMVTSGQDDNTLKCWELPSGKLLKSLTIPTPTKDFWGGIMVGGVSSSGRYFAGGSRDGTISIWDLESGERIKSYTDIPLWVWSIAWSSNEEYIYSGTTDGSLFCWATGIHR